ncbi:VWA domain-containing protein [Deminuibacter soli]|uniref:VWA domain-containing protein n=1 Tax=Deminuibacter soli TaxID=2291815 RepID=A0A3E1NPZ9_9BACT|nr:VWA domain-containing protein [Deminuibacter soli]RFM29868.1 VWA domain-containing protein [Deminuibacter soli]
MLSFEHIEMLSGLLVLLPLALLFVLVLRWKTRVKKALGDEALVNSLTKTYSARLFLLKFLIVLLAIVLGVAALANLRKPEQGGSEKKAGIDVMIALDVSKSMLSEDIKPSRLEKARQFVNLLIDRLGDDRVGFVVFAGQAYLQMPLTGDVAAAKLFVSNASPDAVPVQGTQLGDALRLCDNSLDTKQKKYKAVVLISDGEDHDPKSEEAIKLLNDHGVVVYTVGIGTPEGSPIMEPGANDYKRDENGQTVISKLNEKELTDIATQTNGQYFRLDNSAGVADAVFADMNKLDKKLVNATDNRRYTSFFPLFLALCIALLITEMFIPEVKPGIL